MTNVGMKRMLEYVLRCVLSSHIHGHYSWKQTSIFQTNVKCED